jgi:hypothetical protein
MVGAAAVGALLLAGAYEAEGPQSWAASHGSAIGTPLFFNGPPASVRAAGLFALAAIIVGVLCGWRRLSPAAPVAAGLPLAGFGLLSWLDTYRMTQLFGGSLAGPWSELVSDQVFLVSGCVLLLAAASPTRWRPATLGVPTSRRWKAGTAVLGLAAAPVTWYLVQLTNMSPDDYLASYWWPFRQNPDDSVEALFVLVIAMLGVLAASRSLRITAVVAGMPMLALGLVGLLAPGQAWHLAGAVGLGQGWRVALTMDMTSGLPVLYGGILATAGLSSASRPRPALAAGRWRRRAPTAAIS